MAASYCMFQPSLLGHSSDCFLAIASRAQLPTKSACLLHVPIEVRLHAHYAHVVALTPDTVVPGLFDYLPRKSWILSGRHHFHTDRG